MHDLFLLRHAAAVSESPDGDIGRPLSPLGEREARAAGSWLREHAIVPDRVLCSPARRTRMTAEAVLGELGLAMDPVIESAIYEAAPGTLIGLIDPHADAGTVLVIGHNPGMEQLVGLLTAGASSEARGMPPAGLAWLKVTAPLQPGAAQLHAFWSP